MSDVTQRLSAAVADRYQIERELGSGGMATVHFTFIQRLIQRAIPNTARQGRTPTSATVMQMLLDQSSLY